MANRREFLLKGSVIILICLSALLASADAYQIEKTEAINDSVNGLKAAEAFIQNAIENGKLAGFSALVLKDNQEVFRLAKGYSEIEKKIPIKKNTIFRIYSMTKPITAVALMTLYDEGKFKLDDKVSKYIPEFANIKVYTPQENGFRLEEQENEMTIRHLLTHTSGISYGWDPNSYVDSLYRVINVSGRDAKLEDKMLALAKLPLNFQPGTKWMYGLSIDVAGYLVEVLSGMPFDKFLQERLFTPLKMVDTGFYVPEEKHDRLCGLYNKRRKQPLQLSKGGMADVFKMPAINFSGGGGLVSTIDDYARFCQMLLNKGELEGLRILQPETAQLIMSNQLPENTEFNMSNQLPVSAQVEEGKMGFGLAGAVDLETGEYSWGGLASTNFWINPTNKTIIITCTQILPSNYSYGIKFKKMVESAFSK
ncbi:MAG TPA: serine hydrolase domain-containing protein [Draconibacterium sp.]|nr:serine hydrolase domain-containing protein [Draconibacterium sp.]